MCSKRKRSDAREFTASFPPTKAIDSIVAFFSSKAALERIAARKRLEFVASGYSSGGASYAKRSLIGFSGSSSDADSDIVDDLEILRSRSRLLYMTSPLATGAIKTIRTNVVGSGLALNANIDADFLGLSEEEARAWEANTEREWRLWAETVACDAERKQNFYQLQSVVMLSVLLSDDVFAVMPFIARPGCPYAHFAYRGGPRCDAARTYGATEHLGRYRGRPISRCSRINAFLFSARRWAEERPAPHD